MTPLRGAAARLGIVRLAFVLIGCAALSAQQNEPRSSTPAGAAGLRALVGTWIPVSIEPLTGGHALNPVANPRGLLVFDGAGHVLEIVTHGGRPAYAGLQPTPGEAQAAFDGYGGFWGAYRLDPARKRIVFTPAGAVNPNAMGVEFSRSYVLGGDRLTVTSLPDEPGLSRPTRWTWLRIRELENFTPNHRRLVGFWQHVVEQRVATDGQVISENRRAPSVIVYTPAGYVGVHFVPMNRKAFAAATPTADEARVLRRLRSASRRRSSSPPRRSQSGTGWRYAAPLLRDRRRYNHAAISPRGRAGSRAADDRDAAPAERRGRHVAVGSRGGQPGCDYLR
jgi:hypothetical protein